ncbi:tRNA uridine-5-carboxymethylaminomethyl(34) synthesis GTPase MnmE [Prevotella sp. KH2C16]|uniref:tRNA uridine-5-carboxymethylaminomethyl(34) synthesis GTPase MnmE n=1 Tax=Prevotella sp. KH2C16 TaxID=1855325 RepID=UPI0008E6CAA4|nr:tRNA uridine-5-carboxymethylaminomethyl(34) synthesis GTPase MnmE [Prevotella sp. KH2C16]SFF96960.1 tRNA modification GTPase [Prevotella sp. KH2C16]
MIQNPQDTIAAMATPAGGAIGVIRVSGSEAITITSKLFSKNLAASKANSLHYGNFHTLQGELLDDVIISVYRAPHSYTGEDATEISCHGSRYIMQRILQSLVDAGCRQAMPGEYTERAYLNNKMDLSQAEAIADLVSSTNRASHKLALSQLRGHFSSELGQLREQLLKITSLLELELDFSDHEELEFADRTELLELTDKILNHINALIHSFETGNALKNGIPVAIIGKTNVGKSTLLNKLLHEEKAIVSDIHGTTRDVIEDTTEIDGITFRFIDTAGIRNTQDKVEQLGIERTYQKLDEAIIVLWIIDRSTTDAEVNEMKKKCKNKKLILVRNKIDLEQEHMDPIDYNPLVEISAKYGQGIADLETALVNSADIPEINENSVIVTNVRHYEALTKARESILRVIESMQMGVSGDLISEDLRICIEQLAEITGTPITPNEVLGNIFKHFCVGK